SSTTWRRSSTSRRSPRAWSAICLMPRAAPAQGSRPLPLGGTSKMISSALADEVTDDVLARARVLCPSVVRRVVRAGSGGNSRLYRVDCADASYALKSYPSRAQDRRDRLGVEFQALSFMHRHGITDVPLALAVDAEAGLGLYEWIDGEVVSDP